MEFNREIPLVESYTLSRKEYDNLLYTMHNFWNQSVTRYNIQDVFYNWIRDVWCFGTD